MKKLNVVLIVSGSIAAYKACELASMLIKDGHEVQTLATEGGLRFVGEASLEGLTDRPVYTDLWARRESKSHINLRRWADLFLFYPATANRINKLAAGIADDLLGATFLANNFEKPFWIAPAMNTNMLDHPATRHSLARLESWGAQILPTEEGMLACRDVGRGKLIDPARVREKVRDLARSGEQQNGARMPHPEPALPHRRALVTGGAMRQPIDSVRAIVNTSSGRTASKIVGAFLRAGYQVDYLHYRDADLAGSDGARLFSYVDLDDFSRELLSLLADQQYHAIIQAAAVADFEVQGTEKSTGKSRAKLESGKPATLELSPTAKFLPRLRKLARGSHKPPIIVGFKLTSTQDRDVALAQVQKVFDEGGVDAVLWNDTAGISTSNHHFVLYTRTEGEAGTFSPLDHGSTKEELAAILTSFVGSRIEGESSIPPKTGEHLATS